MEELNRIFYSPCISKNQLKNILIYRMISSIL